MLQNYKCLSGANNKRWDGNSSLEYDENTNKIYIYSVSFCFIIIKSSKKLNSE